MSLSRCVTRWGIEAVTVTLEPQGADRLSIAATVTTVARTGVEMEALTAVTVTALTVYDMCKAVDRAMTITDIRLDEKSGGRSGHYRRHDADVKPSDGGSTEDGC